MRFTALCVVYALFIAMQGALSGKAVGAAIDTPPNEVYGADRTTGISAERLAVIVNEDDEYSVAVADYYVARRAIPPQNVIRVRLPVQSTLSVAEFGDVKSQVVRQTPTNVQAFALTWVQPYRVDCMSITTAFAYGFDRAFCSDRCTETRKSAYLNAATRLPANTLGIFPTMSIAAYDIESARALIDRGIASDATYPSATAYLVSTSDKARNVRAAGYIDIKKQPHAPIHVQIVNAEALTHRRDVIAYFIGALQVADIATNRFLPGAVADHLTSTGGDLLHTHQMSSLEWIRAGATGTYGTVVEPCAFPGKFPDPSVFLKHYLAGETLIEAYWKSVAMPGQGIFIGEPLARPFAKIGTDLGRRVLRSAEQP